MRISSVQFEKLVVVDHMWYIDYIIDFYYRDSFYGMFNPDRKDFKQEVLIQLWRAFSNLFDEAKGNHDKFMRGFLPNIARNVRLKFLKNFTYTGKVRNRTGFAKIRGGCFSINSFKGYYDKTGDWINSTEAADNFIFEKRIN